MLLIAVWWAIPQPFARAEIGSFRHYGVDDGLPQSQVRVIHQDATGYLWVGTQGGLGRFNGREFKRYSSADGLAGNQIESIVDDHAGRIWVGTNVGLCRLEGDSFECARSPLLQGRTISALVAARDRLWVGTDRGLIRLRPADESVVDVRFPDQGVTALWQAGDTLFVGTEAGVIALDRLSGEARRIDLMAGSEPAVVSLKAIGENLWIGTGAGFFRDELGGDIDEFDPKHTIVAGTNVSGVVQAPDGGLMYGSYRGLYRMGAGFPGSASRVPGLGEEIIRSLFLDREGIVWVGHDNGLTKLAPTRFSGYNRDSGLLADFVRTLAQDRAGRLWLGSRVGVQVVPLGADGPALDDSFTLTRADGLPNDRIYAIEFPPAGGALLATNGGVVHWRENDGVSRVYTALDGLASDQVRSLRRDSLDRIWVGTVSGVALLQDGSLITDLPEPLPSVYSLQIVEDDRGWFWFATRDHGLLRLSPEGAVTRLDASDGFSDQTLWDLAPAASGGMWIGTNGDGLFHVRPDGSVAAHLTERDGLANDFVWSVLVDDRGDVWAYTTRGLSRYDGTDFVTYGKGDGLLHLEGGATGSLQSRDGRLWFSSVGGLMQFKSRQNRGDIAPPPVSIENTRVDGAEVRPGARLPHDHAEVTFEFAALSFQSETGIRYRYRLVGLTEDWNELAAYRPVTFAGLGPGEYEFQVVGTNRSGTWSDKPAQFAFSVAAPLWLQSWFVALSGLGLIALVIFVWQYRVRGLRQYSARLSEQVGERTAELERVNRKLREVATTDPLTGVKNRRFLMEHIDHDVAYCLRQGNKSIGFLLIDLDRFKQINDDYGHQAGDAILTKVTELLIEVARESDYVIRWGGDEFLVVARLLEAGGASALAVRIMAAFRETRFSADAAETLHCRCSIGVCSFPFVSSEPDWIDWEHAVEIADAAAYHVKRKGGDGWVEISATEKTQIDSSAEFMNRLRTDAEALETRGQISIRIEGPGSS